MLLFQVIIAYRGMEYEFKIFNSLGHKCPKNKPPPPEKLILKGSWNMGHKCPEMSLN